MTAEEITAIGRRYKQALEERGIPVTAIYLFGSHISGKLQKGSDIDLCVVSDGLGGDDFDDMVTLNQIAKRVAAEIEAFPVSQQEFRRPTDPFIAEALSRGRRIV